jgi:hypothetical protein
MRHAILACLTLLALSTGARAAEAPPDTVEAVWRAQHLTFQYRSQGRMYRCEVLEHKVQRILEQFGARDRVIVRGISCRDFAGVVRLDVVMESPVEATDENIREIVQYDSEDELIARVRGTPLPSAENIERFPAVWESIAIQRAPKVYVEVSDCALVQQLRRQILPKMSVQIVKDIDRVDCTQASPRLTVMALVAKL